MTNKEKMLAEKLFLSYDKELKVMTARARKIMDKINSTKHNNFKKREKIAKKLFGSTGENITINNPIYVDYGSNVHVGENFYANYNLVLLDGAEITIGDDVMFGPNCSIYTASHPIDPEVRKTKLEYNKKVVIGNNVWVGGNVVINPGVTIGDNVIIAAGAVVTKSFPENVIIAGVPAKIIRTLNDDDKKYWKKQEADYYQTIRKEDK